MGDFPSGQRGQTVNLLATPSVVRIHHPPPRKKTHPRGWVFYLGMGICDGGFERRLLATCRWHIATAVAFPQKSESTIPHQEKSSRKAAFFNDVCPFEASDVWLRQVMLPAAVMCERRHMGQTSHHCVRRTQHHFAA